MNFSNCEARENQQFAPKLENSEFTLCEKIPWIFPFCLPIESRVPIELQMIECASVWKYMDRMHVTTWNEFQGGNFIWNMINNRWLTADAHFIFFKRKAKAWNLWNKSDRGATTYYILIAIDVIRVRASQKERESLIANWEIYHKWCEMRQPQPSCERGKKSLCVKESYGANKMNDMFSSVQKERKSSVIFNKKKNPQKSKQLLHEVGMRTYKHIHTRNDWLVGAKKRFGISSWFLTFICCWMNR